MAVSVWMSQIMPPIILYFADFRVVLTVTCSSFYGENTKGASACALPIVFTHSCLSQLLGLASFLESR